MAIARFAAGCGMTSETQVLTRGEQPYMVPKAKIVRTYWVVLSLTVVTAMNKMQPRPESPVQRESHESAMCLRCHSGPFHSFLPVMNCHFALNLSAK